MNWLAVGLGASMGAWCRWHLALRLNTVLTAVPLGTLAANLIGGYLVGLAVALFQAYPGLPEAWRLFLITGLLGGLTTFSTFSAEAMLMLQRGQYLWMLGHSALHLVGSILCCIAGYATFRALT
ncbi:fluoride efflux transporter CrcB [Herminiimonas sp.]|uniref:fluoride efflux transporter CrcB n=1 Tax=Herminiimonas sp. TaxID=1926289 RepID=UPI0027285686|nr:fluoride efflux transporter CrcB [Herminiimonas sp.]MDO8306091.1 fluoride efflux transporter CrcB [Herminiimonas sp.]